MKSAIKLLFMMCLVIVFVHQITGKIYEQCELARDLHYRFEFSRQQVLPNWVCLIEAERSYDTRSINKNTGDASNEYGLFQVSSRFWCEDGFPTGKNVCAVKCSELLSDNIQKAVACAKIVHSIQGYSGWDGWKNKCNGGQLPLLDHCFDQFGNNNLAYAGWSK